MESDAKDKGRLKKGGDKHTQKNFNKGEANRPTRD